MDFTTISVTLAIREQRVRKTLDIERTDDELVIEIPERGTRSLFFRRFRPALLAFGLLGLGALALGRVIGFEWTKLLIAVTCYVAAILSFIAVMVYRQVRPLGTAARLVLDDEGVHLTIGDGDVDRHYPREELQLLQTSELSLPADGERKDTTAQLPGDERYELTLLTETDMQVVGRALARDEAEEASRLFQDHLSNQTRSD